MSLDIRGASGYLWDITRLGRGKVLSLSQGPQAQNTMKDDRCWVATDTQTPTGAGDYFFYMKNDSPSRRIVVTRLTIIGAAVEIIRLRGVTGTAAGGTTLAPISRTVGGAKVPTATIESAVDITGLTSTGDLEILEIIDGHSHVDFSDRPIVLTQDAAIALFAVTGTAAINFALDFFIDLSDPSVIV